MEDEMHGWDVQRMLVDTPCSLMMMIMSLSKWKLCNPFAASRT